MGRFDDSLEQASGSEETRQELRRILDLLKSGPVTLGGGSVTKALRLALKALDEDVDLRSRLAATEQRLAETEQRGHLVGIDAMEAVQQAARNGARAEEAESRCAALTARVEELERILLNMAYRQKNGELCWCTKMDTGLDPHSRRCEKARRVFPSPPGRSAREEGT